MSGKTAGIGLRSQHLGDLLRDRPRVGWLEILADNFLSTSPLCTAQLEAVRSDYPLSLHCVGMSLGGSDAIDTVYLDRLRALLERTEPFALSDHLSFTQVGNAHYHDLLPIPYTAESLRHVESRINFVQEYLGRPLLLENVSRYLGFTDSVMTEGEFLGELAQRTGCGILFDVNNAYVNQVNLGIDPLDVLMHVPDGAIGELHLAGYTEVGDCLIDSHGAPVATPVWELFARIAEKLPHVPVLIEWDNDVPTLQTLCAEAAKADALRQPPLRCAS